LEGYLVWREGHGSLLAAISQTQSTLGPGLRITYLATNQISKDALTGTCEGKGVSREETWLCVQKVFTIPFMFLVTEFQAEPRHIPPVEAKSARVQLGDDTG
jgi:hypothetical protein